MSKTAILIVEDEAIVAADLAGKLRQLGYKVAGITAQGAEAVALAERLSPHLVLMDIQLEGPMDGIETAQAIRDRQDVPVIYLTAHSDAATLSRAKLSGPFGYILKPFDERELATQIELALYKHIAERQLREQREWLRVTLTSIGDAVIATDAAGRISFLNPVAESLTGWKAEEAMDRNIPEVFRIVNEQTGQALEDPVARVLRERCAVALANHTGLVTRDGRTVPIEDSAAPILDAAAKVIGAVLVFHDVTEKRRAENALRASEQRLRWALQGSGGGAWDWDLMRDEGWWSQEMYDLWGVEPGTRMLLKNSLAMVNEQDRERLRRTIEESISRCSDFRCEFRIRHAVRGERWMASYGRTVCDESGRTVHLLGISLDITERKSAETERQKFVSLADQSTEFIGMWDMNFMPFYVNDAGQRLVGLDSLEQACATPVKEFFFPEDQSFIYDEFFPRVLQEGRAEVEIRFRHFKTGERLWMIFNVFYIRDAEGHATGLATVSRNITKRKLAEEALRQSEERLKRSQEIAHLGSWELDLERNELTWSDEVYRIFGLQPQQFAATYEAFLAAVHPDDRLMVNDAYSGSLSANKDNYEVEHRIVRPDGAIRYVHGKCEHHRDGSNKIIRSVGMVHDITEQKQAQEALERSNRELEQFAYVASHDLQEPLRAIVGFLQLLQSRYADQIDEKGRNFIERSVRAGHRMQTLIRELLTLSRVHTKGAVFASTDLNLIVKDVLDNLQSIIQEKNVDITCARLPNLTIDANQIQRLFQNLITNAVRYNENPKPIIDIGCQEHDHAYHFHVKDNGIGISSQFYQRIFKVFQRLHTDREYPGTGLGLALCKKIVERHGGTIWVESQPHAGSTFYFTLPKQRGVS